MSKGNIVQIIGTVVDVEFPPDQLPNIYNALETDIDGEKLMGSLRVEDGKIHSVKLDKENSELESKLIGKSFD